MSYRHTPAMLNEAIRYLNCRPGKAYVDGTLGGSGHAAAICDLILPGGVFIGIDQDIDAINHAKAVLQKNDLQVHILHGNFFRLPEFLASLDIRTVDGILLDLGLSQHQLENSGRGFSFRKDEPLDMRMDIQSAQTAAQLSVSLERNGRTSVERPSASAPSINPRIVWDLLPGMVTAPAR